MKRLRQPGQCWTLGPYGARCTYYSNHYYSHYDAQEDVAFPSDWRDWFDDEVLARMDDA